MKWALLGGLVVAAGLIWLYMRRITPPTYNGSPLSQIPPQGADPNRPPVVATPPRVEDRTGRGHF